MDFVKSRIKMSIGLQRAPKPVSVLDTAKDNQDDENEEELDKDPNVEGLPKKVDQFMSYINRVYFDGKLDLDGKQMFKSDLERMENEESVDLDDHTIETLLNSKRQRKILITT